MKNLAIALLVYGFLVTGCGPFPQTNYQQQSYTQNTPQYYVDMAKAFYSDKFIDIELRPIKGEYEAYTGFRLSVTNKTKSDMRVVWNDSYFIENGKTNGTFMFEGIRYIDRNNPKQDWLIFQQASDSKDIYPTAKVDNLGYDTLATQMGLPTGWHHFPMDIGTYGAYIKIVGKGINKNMRLTIDISK